jgi:hypothetical protein
MDYDMGLSFTLAKADVSANGRTRRTIHEKASSSQLYATKVPSGLAILTMSAKLCGAVPNQKPVREGSKVARGDRTFSPGIWRTDFQIGNLIPDRDNLNGNN